MILLPSWTSSTWRRLFLSRILLTSLRSNTSTSNNSSMSWTTCTLTTIQVPAFHDHDNDDAIVELPVMTCTPSPINAIVGHGLGSDPSQKTHMNDISYHLWTETLEHLQLNMSSNTMEKHNSMTVFYTARGHGASRGWETCPASAFTWSHLTKDMLAVTNATLFNNKQQLQQPFVSPTFDRVR